MHHQTLLVTCFCLAATMSWGKLSRESVVTACQRMRSPITKKILKLILEITNLLTEEGYTIVKKPYGKTQKSIIKEFPLLQLSLNEANNDQKILEYINQIIQLLTGEVPIRFQDVTVYFSKDEWEYIEGQKETYKDVIMVDSDKVTRGLQVTKNRTCLTKLMLNLTLDFFAQLTGEQYLILENDRTTLRSSISHRVSGKRRKKLSSIAKPQLHSLIHDKNNDEKILDLANKIIELLTGEVPIRCDNLTVHFSMEEWEYIEGLKEVYNDVLTENHRPLMSPEKNCPKYASNEKPRRTNVKEKAFSCLICRKSFKYNSKLVRHQLTHTGSKPYACSECPKSFICMADLTRHHKVHTGEKPFTCPECGKCFSEEWNLNKHLNTHIKEKPFTCSWCNKGFATNIALQKHQKIHSKGCLFSCGECGKTFMDKAHLLGHHKVHTGERPYLCLECGKSFAHKHHLGRHLKLHTGERPYSCRECGKTYISKSSLAVHQRIHMAEHFPQCSECGSSFKSHANLEPQTSQSGGKMAFCQKCGTAVRIKSELSAHKGQTKLYSCSCGMSLVSQGELGQHHKKPIMDKPYSCLEYNRSFFPEARIENPQNVHTGAWSYTCSQCGKTLCTKTELTKHHGVHTRERLHNCSECDMCFVTKGYLGRPHIVHTGEKLYNCSQCSKTFCTKTKLTKHHSIHIGERSYSCSVCERCFATKSELTIHHRVHTGEKPYSCSECDKCFARKGSLKTHSRIHTGEKPYSCSECDKCFVTKGDLTRHHRVHTGEKPYSCSKCSKSFSTRSELTKHQRSHR